MKKFLNLSVSACLCLAMVLGSISCYGKTKSMGTSTKTSSVGALVLKQRVVQIKK